MTEISTPIGNLNREQFLEEYWQKKPLVIRQAFPSFESPLSAEEIAGLACEEDINSRILLEKDGEHPWQPIFGPMDEETFARMPETHWTLIVNDLEKHIPELAWITDQFNFIPEWRFDDLMTSYAADHGSVGPHMDLYDVFILQGEGRRRWQINSQPVAADNQVKETPLRIQKTFEAEQEWILEPGDILYIPPGVSHHGVSLGESISYSIGFRAISHNDLVNDFIGFITRDLDPNLTYRDPDLELKTSANEFDQQDVDRVRAIFRDYLNPDHPALTQWFGRFMSDPKADLQLDADEPISDLGELEALLAEDDAKLLRHPASRFAFTRHEDHCLLFIDGQQYNTSTRFTEMLCEQREINLPELLGIATVEEQDLLTEWYNSGKLYLHYNDA